MPAYSHAIGSRRFVFDDLKTLLARATPDRSGDHLAGVAAASAEERAAAQMALAQVPLRQFLNEAVVPYESDEVTRLIIDTHDAVAFSKVAHQVLYVGAPGAATPFLKTLDYRKIQRPKWPLDALS